MDELLCLIGEMFFGLALLLVALFFTGGLVIVLSRILYTFASWVWGF